MTPYGRACHLLRCGLSRFHVAHHVFASNPELPRKWIRKITQQADLRRKRASQKSRT